ncbi:hypothetical protein MTR_4g086700 [Medicago truncatula]|uniref:Uncharacterized protein n=1 Tax=Medicago truncatula TaxID=3880 RepID=G7JMH0_MEDTR|nr:hypothetical protein MTR_4g086700 [Medicago truncatula]
MYGLSPPKLAPERIEPKTSGGANSKIPNQPLESSFLFTTQWLHSAPFSSPPPSKTILKSLTLTTPNYKLHRRNSLTPPP